MMPTVPDVLRAAAALVADGWTQERFSRDAWGDSVSPTCEDARCFCALGAIHRAVFDLTEGRTLPGMERVKRAAIAALFGVLPVRYRAGEDLPAVGVTRWNDEPGRKPADVLAALEAAAG